MSIILVIGGDGQDGRLLFDRLSGEGHGVTGLGRCSARSNQTGLPIPVTDILDQAAIQTAIGLLKPDQIYYLAAHHHAAEDKAPAPAELLRRSFAVHVGGLMNFLEAIRIVSPHTRLFYAASSHIFGQGTTLAQDENTPLAPRCAYGITKTAGLHCCRFYRANYGISASVGILYNHESPLRRAEFVSQKIVRAAIAISRNKSGKLVLGDLSACIDWGYAPDYVDAMIRILALPESDEFVIATGEAHSVQEFVELAFAVVGLDWKTHVEENPSILTKPKLALVGNAAKLRATTGWRPSLSFQQMVETLVKAALAGESHPKK